MESEDLKAILQSLGISQSDFARLVGVTARGVSLWMTGDRAIPGPAAAYARLLQSLPVPLRQVELSRLKQRSGAMGAVRDGLYELDFRSIDGGGRGTLVVENGRAYGGDAGGVRYDGSYAVDDSGLAEFALRLSFPANGGSIFGVSHPYEWSIDVRARIDPRQTAGRVAIETPVGPRADARWQYIRPLPDA